MIAALSFTATGEPTATLVVLVVLLAVGVFAGLAQKGRGGLLVVGLAVAVVVGLIYARVGWPTWTGPREVLGPQLALVYAAVVPPVVAFLAGFLLARGSWVKRVVVVVVAVLILAGIPYAAVGQATADVILAV